MEKNADIIVAGGGLGGSLAALALAHQGFTVCLVDAAPPAQKTLPDFDGRTTALAYASTRLFRRLGLWHALAPEAGPIRDILVTDGRPADRFRKGHQASGFLHFDSTELAENTPLGWIVENRRLRQVMHDALEASDAIRVIAPAMIGAVETGPAAVTVPLDTGETLTASLLVAADGRRSPLRERAGIRTLGWSYPQTGIVCTVAHEKDHLGIAQEFFLPSGPFAILPMTGRRSSLVWTEKADRAGSFLALGDEDFTAEIAKRFGPYLGALSLDGPRWSYPLAFHLATKFYGERMALVGDAAHGIHPIAGQGYNLGVKDIAALCDVLAEHRGAGLDIGHGSALAQYDRWRQFDSASLAFGTDVLNRLFSNDNPALRLARSTGIGLVNRIDPLRNFFMKQAGADLGTLPSLMQP
ncbi:FAD-dependent monooxygenase [Aquisalinus flavus]|nr:FAD-dependent monooxygenase [Aquisalinus flavus]MBD0425701.1 FAD-dependent monooxygenase [Aquisalinus flavus]UNE48687.1 FAD-binding protein [Aquisalinus flavus]